jgi:hypothetical protein
LVRYASDNVEELAILVVEEATQLQIPDHGRDVTGR